METIQRLARTWVASGRDEEVDQTVAELTSKRATLLHLVQALGEFLTAEEDDSRNKGVEFMSLVISRCPSDLLNRQSVRVLVTFYCSKLDDTETIIPSLKGLVPLTTQSAFTSIDAVDVIKAIFTHVKMSVLVQSQRFMVFTIVDSLVARHREGLRAMGKEFLSGYIRLAEGEKDPRNLLLAFAIARVLLIEFDVADHIEDLFNITFCYFPIMFRPPPGDPYGITAEDLKRNLRECLSATPAFGKMAIPLFIEKLTMGTPATKRDTLVTLDACLPVYGPSLAREFARKLWNSLKLEIFQPVDSATEAEALKTTQILVQVIYTAEDSESRAGEDLEGLAKEACEECLQILREPEKSQAQPAMKVLCAFMSTTPAVARFTLAKAVPHLVKLFLDPDEVSNRAPTLKLLSDIIIASRDSMSKDPEVLPTDGDTPLSPYKDEVLGVLTVGLKNPPSSMPALEGLKGMVTTKGLLTDEELGFVVHNINELLQKDDKEDVESSDSALDLLLTIALTAPSHVSQTTLPMLFSTLPDSAPPREAELERVRYWRTLASLKRLCKQPDLFETLVVRLWTKLDLVCASSSARSGAEEVDTEPNAAYAHSLLRTIADTLSSKVEAGHPDVAKYLDQLLPRLYNLFIYSAIISTNEHSGYTIATDPRLISVAAKIVTLVVRTLPSEKQAKFAASLFAAFLRGELKPLADGQQKNPVESKFDPFNPASPPVQRNVLLLFAAAVIAFRPDVSLPVPDEAEFLDMLLRWIGEDGVSDLQRDSIIHALSSVVNKRADGVPSFLSDSLPAFWKDQIAESQNGSLNPAPKRKVAILVWTWVCKALLTRKHPLAKDYTDRLFELFDDADVYWDAAIAIGKIPSTDKIITKKNHAILKILYAQQFCSSVMPRIIEGAKASPSARQQQAFLVALTSLIKSVPRTVYAHEFPVLMPLLLRGLELPDAEVRANVIDTLLATADSKDEAISEHASSLVSIMLKNSMVQEMPTVRVRIAALRYLARLPDVVRYDVLHPQKAIVVRELAKVLDDPKRSVRQEAVEARTNWFKFSG